MALTTLPPEESVMIFPSLPEAAFRSRILRCLEWFGLLEALPMAANDNLIQRLLYRRTPLFDRLIAFDDAQLTA